MQRGSPDWRASLRPGFGMPPRGSCNTGSGRDRTPVTPRGRDFVGGSRATGGPGATFRQRRSDTHATTARPVRARQSSQPGGLIAMSGTSRHVRPWADEGPRLAAGSHAGDETLGVDNVMPALVDHAPIGIGMIARDRSLAYANEALRRIG